jgi:hypothetical protein
MWRGHDRPQKQRQAAIELMLDAAGVLAPGYHTALSLAAAAGHPKY